MILQLPVSTTNQDEFNRRVAQTVNAILAQDANLPDYADDTAAAAGGVGIGQPYRNGSVRQVRVA